MAWDEAASAGKAVVVRDVRVEKAADRDRQVAKVVVAATARKANDQNVRLLSNEDAHAARPA